MNGGEREGKAMRRYFTQVAMKKDEGGEGETKLVLKLPDRTHTHTNYIFSFHSKLP